MISNARSKFSSDGHQQRRKTVELVANYCHPLQRAEANKAVAAWGVNRLRWERCGVNMPFSGVVELTSFRTVTAWDGFQARSSRHICSTSTRETTATHSLLQHRLSGETLA